MCNSAPSPMRRLGALVHPPCVQGPSDWKRSSMDTQEPTPQEEAFTLGEPALVCRWRMTARRVPLLNRHIRALGARRLNGEAVPRSLLSWAKQHIEWTLADGATQHPDGVLMVVVDVAGRAAMTVGPYEPLVETEPLSLAARALASAREAASTGVAPETLWSVRDGALVWGAAEGELPSGAATLVLDLARTLGVAVTRGPRLAEAVAAGEADGAHVLLVSDEHGVVPAAGCDDELARRLAQGYATLLEKASRRPCGA